LKDSGEKRIPQFKWGKSEELFRKPQTGFLIKQKALVGLISLVYRPLPLSYETICGCVKAAEQVSIASASHPAGLDLILGIQNIFLRLCNSHSLVLDLL